MFSNWTGWHTVLAILGAIGTASQFLSHAAGLPPVVVEVSQVVGQVDNVLMMVVGILTGSAMAKAGGK